MKKASLLFLIIISLIATSFAGIGVPRASALTVTTVTMSTHQAGATSSYSIASTIGVALQASLHMVVVTFPIGTTVPNAVLPVSSVTLNGAGASSIGYPGTSTIAPTVTIYVPAGGIAVGNLTIAISTAAGIKNPTVAGGSYTLSVATTPEPTPVNSSAYSIIPAIANITVSVDPASAGQAAAYTVSFTAGSAIAPGSWINLTFPTGTTVPSSYAPNTIYVMGVSALAYGSGQTVIIYVPGTVSIVAGGFSFIQISSTANIKNPQTPGTYQLYVSTNVDTTPVASTGYQVTGSSVASVSLAVDPKAQSASAEFTIAFRTSASGGLAQNSGTITVDFPYNITVPTSINRSLVMVNGTAAHNVVVGTDGAVVITTPQAIAASSLVTVVFSRDIGIHNPSSTGTTVTLSVFTSTDVAPVSTSYTTIASQITQPQVQLTSYGVSSVSGYTITFSTGAVGSLHAGYDTISVTFPSGSTLPGTISRDLIKVNNVAAYSVSVSGNRLMIVPAVNITASSAVQVTIDKTAGIKNPSVAQSTALQVYTSVEVSPVSSAAYAIVNLPRTLILVSPANPDGLSGYYKTRPTVALTATSSIDPAPVVYYSINGGAQQIYAAPFQLLDGNVVLTYYARDRQGNQEDAQTFTAKVDATAPMATIISPAQGAIVGVSPVTIVGKVSPGMQVSVAGSPVTVSATGDFSTSVALKEGSQTIIFTVTSVSGNVGQAQLAVALDTTPPVLTITKPVMYSTVVTGVCEVAGKTEPGATVKVAGSAVTVNADGTFSMNVMLKEGDNLIEITATDTVGNQRKTAIPVTFKARTAIHLQIGNKTALVNDVKKTLQAAPVIVKGTTMVPLRFVGEAFGATVTWDPVFQIIDIELKGSTVRLQIGANFASVAGKKVILQAVPVIIKGTTMVPIRFISEAFGAQVVWTAATQGIDITYPKP
jgi:hypothetical protein